MGFQTQYSHFLDRINQALEKYMEEKDVPEKSIYSAMRYSLMAGGKRLRPVLALAVCDMLDGELDHVIPFACSIEMIHTYSLIHDDLPAMDNDDYRRGRLTNHKVFGEAKAVLAGDGLLNYAFEIMLDFVLKNPAMMTPGIKAMNLIAKASGVSGMIGGQVVDLESEGKKISSQMLEYMHRCKTGALIKAPIMAAAQLCNAEGEALAYLEQYADKIGLAFQIKDDILDIEGNFEALGKSIGSDTANDKSTFITLYGLEESKRMLREMTEEAVVCIGKFGDKSGFMKELAEYLLKRDK